MLYNLLFFYFLYLRTNEDPKESRENTELQENIKRLETETSTYKKRLEIATEEREKLISSLALANGMKEIMEANLHRTTEELKVQEEERDQLQKQLKMMMEAENRKQEKRDAELDEIRRLHREISIARETRINLETDINLAKQKLKESSDRELKLTHMVESLKERETELNTKLIIAKEKEKNLKDWIENLQPSLKTVAEREEDMRNKLVNFNKDVPASSMQRIKELNELVEKYSVEKNNLKRKLDRITIERDTAMQRVKLLEGQIKKLKSAQALTSNSNSITISIEKVSNFFFFVSYNYN